MCMRRSPTRAGGNYQLSHRAAGATHRPADVSGVWRFGVQNITRQIFYHIRSNRSSQLFLR